MKIEKLYTLLLSVMALGATSGIYAQCSPDPSNTTSLVFPAPGDTVFQAEEGQPFAGLITLNIPVDTTINIGVPVTLTIDSAILMTVTGMPPGIGYSCQNSGCVTLGGESGCIELSGTPVQEGTYDITATLAVYAGAIVQTLDPETYTLEVSKANSIPVIKEKTFTVSPNPANTFLDVVVPDEAGAVVIRGLSGQTVLTSRFELKGGRIDISNLDSGVYFVTVESEGVLSTRKISIVR